MKHYLCLIFALLGISCSNKSDYSDQNSSVDWLRSYNDKVLKNIKQMTALKGNRPGDSLIAITADQFVRNNRRFIQTLDQWDSQDAISASVDDYLKESDLNKLNLAKYFKPKDLEKEDGIEIKRKLLLYELETLHYLGSQIGADDISIAKLNLFFIPDEYTIKKGEKLKGRLYLAGTSNDLPKNVNYYLGDHQLEKKNGYGIIEDFNEQPDDSDSLSFKIKFHESELKRKIKIREIK